MNTEEKAQVVTAARGTELIQFHAALAFLHQDDLPVHTIPNNHPTKMDVLPKTLDQIILTAK